MSKSIDNILKQLIESQEAQTKAFEAKFATLAECTYPERLKKMEDGLTEAMKKVLEMDASIKEYHKATGSKVDEIEKKYGDMFPKQDQTGERKKEQETHEKNEPESIQKKEDADMKDAEKQEKQKEQDKKDHLKEDTQEFKQEKKNMMKAEDGEEGESEEDEKDEEKEASNQLGGINKQQMVNAPMNQKRHRENPMGKPRNNAEEKKDKLIVDGAEPSAQEAVEAPQAEEVVKTPVAETAVAAPVATETPAPSALEVLNSKIEAALEKLASVSIQKPQASTEVAVSEAVALEAKAKEEAALKYKALEERFESLMAKVSTIEKSASTVETKAAQIVAKQGTEAVAISVDQEVVAETDSDIYKKFEALTGVDQRKFYLANKQTIERHASSILRSKRS